MPLSRRQFVVRSAAAAAALPFVSPLARAAASRPDGFEALRRGVGAFTGRGGTIGYLQTDDALVAVDAQFPEQARTFLDGLRSDGRGLDLLVNTHHHGDHTAGNAVLAPQAARHVAHEAVPGLQRASASRGNALEAQRYASETFSRTWSADVGDEVVSLSYYGPAHTAGDAVVHFERADVVHMGDLVFNRRQPFIDRGAGASVENWVATLQAVRDRHSDDTVFVFGHAAETASVVGTRADLLVFRGFLESLYDTVEDALFEGRTAADLEGMLVPGHDEWGPAPMRVVEPVVEEIEAE